MKKEKTNTACLLSEVFPHSSGISVVSSSLLVWHPHPSLVQGKSLGIVMVHFPPDCEFLGCDAIPGTVREGKEYLLHEGFIKKKNCKITNL